MFLRIVYVKWEQLYLKAPWWEQNHRALAVYIKWEQDDIQNRTEKTKNIKRRKISLHILI